MWAPAGFCMWAQPGLCMWAPAGLCMWAQRGPPVMALRADVTGPALEATQFALNPHHSVVRIHYRVRVPIVPADRRLVGHPN